jgi:hypothetical protein
MANKVQDYKDHGTGAGMWIQGPVSEAVIERVPISCSRSDSGAEASVPPTPMLTLPVLFAEHPYLT